MTTEQAAELVRLADIADILLLSILVLVLRIAINLKRH